MPRGLPSVVKTHLEKARESAILAVEVYNKPTTTFRTGGFIVLMCIAWTALLHAIFFRRNIKPFHKDPQHPTRYLKVDGDYKAWELKDCVDMYFGSETTPVRKNLLFFIGLRNKIEHRSMPALDINIFGECQALLFNFEDMLFREFGAKYALNESLALALQFSQMRAPEQAKAMASLHSPLAKDIADYLRVFRSGLTTEEFQDLKFSYKVFLIPKVVNRQGQDDLAVEFVQFNPGRPDEMEKYQQMITLMKPRVQEAVNVGRMKPGEICKVVEPIVKHVVGQEAKFTASFHHVAAVCYFKVRPVKGEGDPNKTNGKYCIYDSAHKDYLFTPAWLTFLSEELKKPDTYQKMIEWYRKKMAERYKQRKKK